MLKFWVAREVLWVGRTRRGGITGNSLASFEVFLADWRLIPGASHRVKVARVSRCLEGGSWKRKRWEEREVTGLYEAEAVQSTVNGHEQ